MEKEHGKYDVWDWIVTKSGDVRQITHDDMMDLKYEDIERHATMEELPADEAMKRKNILKLLPCPFCGGEADIFQVSKNGLHLKCKSCLMGLKQKVIRYSLDWLRERMIENWNKRVTLKENNK